MLGKSILCLEIVFYYAEVNNKIMKGTANLLQSFEIVSLG